MNVFFLLAQARVELAHPMPTWTDKEVLVAVGSTLAAVLSIFGIILRLTTSWYRSRARKAEVDSQRLRKERADLQRDVGSSESGLTALRKDLVSAQAEASQLAAMHDSANAKLDQERGRVETLKANLDAAVIDLEKHAADLAGERRRIGRALQKGGQTWTEKVLANAPDFKSLEPEGRRTPILSVLNLKGGVGKTTIAANLGTALDSMGYRVLLVDLDLQGSLTGLFLPDSDQAELYDQERLVGDFLAASFGSEFPSLLDYIRPILSDGKSGIVPTTDALAYAETNLTIRWLLRECNRDPRFLLRRELQFKRVTNSYDIVVLDCPPLINVCCVNALAASDYLLVPILPSQQATARVPVLMKRLTEFRENINPALKVMGIVTNRTQRSELTADEENRLSLLGDQCRDIFGEAVPQFETFIRQNVELRVAEDNHRPLTQDDEMFRSFLDLAREVESHLPMFCRAGASSAVQETAS